MYDGYKVRIFRHDSEDNRSLMDNRVAAIHEDKEGNIWVGTRNGLSKFDRISCGFTNYDISIPGKQSTYTYIFSIYEDSKENLWLSTEMSGLIRFNRESGDIDTQKILYNESKILDFEGISFSIHEDGEQNLWVSSFDHGLLKYDSEQQVFIPIVPDKKNPNRFINEKIWQILGNKEGYLWLATDAGVYEFDLKNNNLRNLGIFNQIPRNPYIRYASSMSLDNTGNIWISTALDGLFKYNPLKGSKTQYKDNFINSNSNNREYLTCTYIDKSNILWVGTWNNGIFKIDFQKEPFRTYRHSFDQKGTLSGNNITSIFQSRLHPDILWIGTKENGLNKFYRGESENDKQFQRIETDIFNSVTSLLEDKNGILWVGTENGWLFRYDVMNEGFVNITEDRKISNDIMGSSINVINEDGNGFIWVGTNEGLNRINPVSMNVHWYKNYDYHSYNSTIMSIIRELSRSEVTLASLVKVGNSQELSETFEVTEETQLLVYSVGESIPNNSVWDFGWIENSVGDTVWKMENYVGTRHAGGHIKNRAHVDLLNFKPGSYQLKFKTDESHGYGKWNQAPPAVQDDYGIQLFTLSMDEADRVSQEFSNEDDLILYGSDIRDLYIDSNDIVWIGTYWNGLIKFDPASNEQQNYRKSMSDSGINSNRVYYIYPDSVGFLWLATENGLNRFDIISAKSKNYTKIDGLPTNHICSIIDDDHGSLWISTKNGISRFNYHGSSNSYNFVNYDIKDGLQGYEFNTGVAAKGANGNLYFGGMNGINSITPMKINMTQPEVAITDIKIENRSISFLEDETPLSKSILMTDEINLNYDQNDISFEFTALHYSRPERNKYAYRLQGFNNNWVYDNKRYASYTNLDPGTYTFQVKASNSDGIWNDTGRSLLLRISPPWWRTRLAYIVYTLIFFSALHVLIYYQKKLISKKEREKARVREAEIRAQLAEKENERKTNELEEARKLQLSMLPLKIPRTENLDIAVYMKTATEVGGDYYDFSEGHDGSVTIAIGDATGHGLKSGNMVSIIKGLFCSEENSIDPLAFINKCNRTIKQMRLGNLYMALTLLKIKDRNLEITAAGMPPIFLYRAESKQIEEIVLKSMPLGAFIDFTYEELDIKLNPGDTILLQTDGMAELFRDNNEMFDYDRIKKHFYEVATHNAEKIINHLINMGNEWCECTPHHDDISFVVIKVKK